MTPEEREARRQRARELRLAGYSRSQIAAALGIRGNGALSRLLDGVPPPNWTRRPRAKDELREKAIALRLSGHTYDEIRRTLDVAISSVSLWVRDIPMSDAYWEASRIRKAKASARRSRALRRRARLRDQAIVDEAQAQILNVDERDLFVAGVVAYWAEGAKNKPWRRGERISFMNSDPKMIVLFIRWLELIGLDRDDLTFRVSIHETADVAAAVRFWASVVGVSAQAFAKTTLKRHNPRTVRKNVGSDYYGCLTVDVRRSAALNRRIEGWFYGLVANLPTHRPANG